MTSFTSSSIIAGYTQCACESLRGEAEELRKEDEERTGWLIYLIHLYFLASAVRHI